MFSEKLKKGEKGKYKEVGEIEITLSHGQFKAKHTAVKLRLNELGTVCSLQAHSSSCRSMPTMRHSEKCDTSLKQ